MTVRNRLTLRDDIGNKTKVKGEKEMLLAEDFLQMALDLYAEVGYVNSVDIIFHSGMDGPVLLSHRDAERREVFDKRDDKNDW